MRSSEPPARANIGRARRRVACALGAAPRLAALWLAVAVGGCSAVIPLPSFIGSRDDVTGSIKPANLLSSEMDVEDWRRANGAMALALDPQGNGEPVAWDNPKSGAKGAFTPVGPAKPVDARICRSFVAALGGSLPQRSLQGSACRGAEGDWSIGEIAPFETRAASGPGKAG